MITPAIYKCPSCGWHGNNPDLLNELGWTCASCKRTYAFTIADPTIPAYLAGETSRAEETPRCPACDDTTVCGHDYHWGSVNAEIAALRQQVKDLQGELHAIDAILARRPALDLPTRWENIEKAISYAKRTEHAEAEVKTRDEQIARGERVFEAVVYAYEGRDVPPDLESHGFVNRGRRHHASAQALREALEKLIADWRERARRVRPLESAPLTAEKRKATAEWMFYTNRANELEAALTAPSSTKKE